MQESINGAQQILSGELPVVNTPMPAHLFTSSSLPIDARVSDKIRAKIWNNEFVEFGALLTNPVLDNILKLTIQNADGGSTLSLCVEPWARAKRSQTIESWLSSFHVFVGVYTSKYPYEAPTLMKYGEVVQDLAARGQNWHFYYKNLRQSQPSSFPWGATHWELWLRSQFHQAKTSQSSGQAQSKSVKENWPAVPKGYCFKYHRGMACSGCQFKHSCFKCDGVHRATQCNFRRPDNVSKERPEAAKSYRKPQSDKSRITSAQPPIPVRIERLQFLLDGYSPSTVCYLVSGFFTRFSIALSGHKGVL